METRTMRRTFALLSLVLVLASRAAPAGDFVTSPSAPTLFPDKAPAPGQTLRPGWNSTHVFAAADANALKSALLDVRAELRGREVNVLHYGADPTGATDSTTAIQSALNASGAAQVVFPAGTYRISGQLTQHPGTWVHFDGGAYLQPNAATWSGAYVWRIYDDWNNPALDFVAGQYERAARTGVTGMRINPTGSISATCIYGSDGGGILIQDARTWGCRNGGVFLEKGYEWRLNAVSVLAPSDAVAGAAGLKIATSDSMVSQFASAYYPKGVHLTTTATSNVLADAHVWGMPQASGVGKLMNLGFHVEGAGNQFFGAYADTPEKLTALTSSDSASLANGGVGFYVSGWENAFTACHVIGSARLSKAVVVDSAQDNSFLGCIAPFDAAKFEASGYLVLQGGALASRNLAVGGTLAKSQLLPVSTALDASGNTRFGAIAFGTTSPGFDATPGTVVYNTGQVGQTLDGTSARVANRITSEGAIDVFRYAGTTVGRIHVTATGLEVEMNPAGAKLVWRTAAPTSGTWVAGSQAINSAPAVGSPKGWRCTVGGTPGTWVSEGNL